MADLRKAIQSEFVKCAKDPVHFMKKYCKIQHPKKGTIPFHLYTFQEKCLDEFKNHRYNIVLKSRQMGISTLSAGYSLWLMLFHEDKNVLVIATKQEVAKNLVTKVREMHKNLPAWLRGKCLEDNRLSMRFGNGSQIKAVSSSPDAARSEALSLLIIDEAAFIDYMDEIWTSAQSTLSTGGDCIILSTPNGIGNFFHKCWEEAEQGINGFNSIKLKWDLHPDRDLKWREEQDVLLGTKKAAQECDTDFISSGDTVIDGDILKWYKDNQCLDPIEKRGHDRNYWLWDYPNFSKRYLVSADVARGDGSDFSTFEIIDLETLEQVAEYRGKLPPREFGRMLVSVATEWNKALLVIENSNVGFDTCQEVIENNYSNLFYTSEDIQYVEPEKQITNKLNARDKKMVPGFTTSVKTRPLIISKLDAYITQKEVIIHSHRLIDELFVFIWKNGKAQSSDGYNDDLVLSYSIGLWIRDTALRLLSENIDYQKQLINSFKVVTNENIGYYPGMTKPYQQNASKAWKMNVGPNTSGINDKEMDLTWLLK